MLLPIEYRNTMGVTLLNDQPDTGTPVSLVGYASTFDTPYEIQGIVETIDKRAFDRTLKEQPDVFALLGHDPNRVLARTKAGSLKLSVDERGLRVEIVPIDTQDGRDVVQLIRSGHLDAMSFGFVVAEDDVQLRDGKPHRNITDLHLHEVSIVTWPANPSATISESVQQRAKALVTPKPKRVLRLPPYPLAYKPEAR